MLIELLILVSIFFIGSFIQGVSGFGFGLIAMSFLPLLFTVKESTLLVVALAFVLSVSIAVQMFRHIQWKAIIILLSAALLGRICAFFILDQHGDNDILKVLLGIFLIAVVVYFFKSKRPDVNRVTNRTWLPALLGLGGGLVGGVFAVGGPFFVFYMLLIFSNDKYAYSANLQVSFVMTSLTTILLHGINGDFNVDFFVYFLVGVISVLVGSRIGVLFFKRISQENIKKLAAVVVAVAAINLILFG
ncbi:sulfite exporter TauE/SafE family protein [Salipaludibacillus sp. HK11]|uniref:sulfite exporter TauE/SafE family protein n=1 Tax=Salipaludibacillus sp. HK11 TaxID=3394320 RepID=UPI0039FCB928